MPDFQIHTPKNTSWPLQSLGNFLLTVFAVLWALGTGVAIALFGIRALILSVLLLIGVVFVVSLIAIFGTMIWACIEPSKKPREHPLVHGSEKTRQKITTPLPAAPEPEIQESNGDSRFDATESITEWPDGENPYRGEQR